MYRHSFGLAPRPAALNSQVRDVMQSALLWRATQPTLPRAAPRLAAAVKLGERLHQAERAARSSPVSSPSATWSRRLRDSAESQARRRRRCLGKAMPIGPGGLAIAGDHLRRTELPGSSGGQFSRRASASDPPQKCIGVVRIMGPAGPPARPSREALPAAYPGRLSPTRGRLHLRLAYPSTAGPPRRRRSAGTMPEAPRRSDAHFGARQARPHLGAPRNPSPSDPRAHCALQARLAVGRRRARRPSPSTKPPPGGEALMRGTLRSTEAWSSPHACSSLRSARQNC